MPKRTTPRTADTLLNRKLCAGLIAAFLAPACSGAAAPHSSPASPAEVAAASFTALEAEVRAVIRRHAADTAEIAVALIDLERGDSLLIDAHTVMHAASTMKVPVMVELFRMQDAGMLRVDDPIEVRNRFRSIADGSEYALSVDDDSEGELYRAVGSELPMRALIEPMIVRSSNLATNILIEMANPARIAETLASMGAAEMRVLRGVEDIPAFERGMNNSTTAHAYMKVLESIARGTAASTASVREMNRILERQHFREQIPAGLPPGVRVGNKTGSITRINHDGAIVWPEGRAPYVLVVLTRGFLDKAVAATASREISEAVHAKVAGAR
jgi:beta-lactamase class A